MRKAMVVLLALAFLSLFSGCYSMPDDLQRALVIQAEYTRAYVRATCEFTGDDPKTRGIGERLVENCDAIEAMVAEYAKE